jgi:hypothetical protein
LLRILSQQNNSGIMTADAKGPAGIIGVVISLVSADHIENVIFRPIRWPEVVANPTGFEGGLRQKIAGELEGVECRADGAISGFHALDGFLKLPFVTLLTGLIPLQGHRGA